MNAATLLGRLKFGGGERGRSRPERTRQRGGTPPVHRGGDTTPGPLPRPLVGAGAMAALGFAGLIGWLALNAGETITAWKAAIPSVSVQVAGLAAPLPPAAPPPPVGAAAEAAAVTPAPVPQGPVELVPAPVPALVEETRNGPLPRIAEDGRMPWQVYARPFPANDRRPRIAIVLADMGLSGVTTGNALQKLPPTVTLAFVPFAERLDSWMERARAKGHEVLLSLPMEPQGYPRNDPGPNALLTMLAPDRNRERLESSLGRAVGYVGVTSTTGSRFTGSSDAMQPVMEMLKARGLLFLDSRVNPNTVGPALARQADVPRAVADRVIDRDLSRGAIDEQLKELEAIAKANGAAVGIGSPYPSTIERINTWLTGLEDRGFVIAPVSAVVNMQKGSGG